MLKPERVTFPADDDNFHQFPTSEHVNSYLNQSLVHYSTDFKRPDPPSSTSSSIRHSNSFDELSAITMNVQEPEQQPMEHAPPASSASSFTVSNDIPPLTETNLHQFDALTLQQLAIGSHPTSSDPSEPDSLSSPSRSASLADVEKELDRVRQLRYGRTYSSPTSSLCSRITSNPFSAPNGNLDLGSITNAVQFTDQSNPSNRLPFSSTYITSIPESIVPVSGSSSTNTTNDNHFIPIHQIESPTLEDREVFETFHTKPTSMPGIAIRQSGHSLNRNISTSETDLLASLHRSASKQGLDNQSEHGTTYSGTSDDIIFVEWDKERNLFQDYINSLRTEIRVLLQERADYQKQMDTISSNLSEHQRLNVDQTNHDESKLSLLQKALEEKNTVLEQLQKEYETVREKNSNLARKVSVLRCDSKAQSGVIDELKQKIAELTVDIQNHILVKRRLEISMLNLETDCKLIDAERVRLSGDVKNTQLSKQDLEKLLQQANVKIAEQGSTIEMLRSDNVQVRSQLSTTQRRMLQEKQQIMDYLRQIETDLVEKEQLKQRESFLRKDVEQLQAGQKKDRQEIERLKSQINDDKAKLDQLEQERLQLFKTIQGTDDTKGQVEHELDSYRSATKRLCAQLRVPFAAAQSIDQAIPLLEERCRAEQVSQARIHQIPLVQSASDVQNGYETEDVRQLREDLSSMTAQLTQMNEANAAWQLYVGNSLSTLRDRFQLPEIESGSFEDAVQLLENRFHDLNQQLVEVQHTDELRSVEKPSSNEAMRPSNETQTEETNDSSLARIDAKTPSLNLDSSAGDDELQHLRETVAALTTQCTQLDEANRAWQLYQVSQLDSFREKLQNSVPIEKTLSLDETAQHISVYFNQISIERDALLQKVQNLETIRDDLLAESANDVQIVKRTYTETITELNQQLDLLKQQNDQLETEKHLLNEQLDHLSAVAPESTVSVSKLAKVQNEVTPFDEARIHNVTPQQSASPLGHHQHQQELQQLRGEIATLTNQCAQLDEANQAWQLYHATQVDSFRNKLAAYLRISENGSLDVMVEEIGKQLQREGNELRSESAEKMESVRQAHMHAVHELNEKLAFMAEQLQQLEAEKQLNLTDANEAEQRIRSVPSPRAVPGFEEVGIHTSGVHVDGKVAEVEERMAALTAQCAQLDEANKAWQLYHTTQVDAFRNKLHEHLSLAETGSLDDLAEQIVEQVQREREDAADKYKDFQRVSSDLRGEWENEMESTQLSHMGTVRELNEQVRAMAEQLQQLEAEKQSTLADANEAEQRIHSVPSPRAVPGFEEVGIHTSGVRVDGNVAEVEERMAALTAQCAQLDEANKAWQLYHATQVDSFRNKLHEYLSLAETGSLDDLAEQIVEQVQREREDAADKYKDFQRVSSDLRGEWENEMESAQLSHMGTVRELNEKLVSLTEQLEQLEAEKQLNAIEDKQRQQRSVPSVLTSSLFKEVPIHASGSIRSPDSEELAGLRERVLELTTQCAQLDEANRTWQLYHATQMDTFKNKLQFCLTVDDIASFDLLADQILAHINQERQLFETSINEIGAESSNNLESMQQSYVNTINGLNQELLGLKANYAQLDAERQALIQHGDAKREMGKQTSDWLSSDMFRDVPLQTSAPPTAEQDTDELLQLRENLAAATIQCTQLQEANQAWQQFHQSQLESFRAKLDDCLRIDEALPLEHVAQQIVDRITEERQVTSARYQTLEKEAAALQRNHQSCLAEAEVLTLKTQYENSLNEKDSLIHQLQSLSAAPRDELDTQSAETNFADQQHELSELRNQLAQLTAHCTQLDEDNRAWQQCERSHVDLLNEVLPSSNKTTLAEIIEDALAYIQHLRSEEDLHQEKESLLAQELDKIRNQRELAKEPKRVNEQGTQANDDTVEESLVALQNQYEELDGLNQTWQSFYDNQMNLLQTKFNDYISFDDEANFDDIIHLIASKLEQQRQHEKNSTTLAATDASRENTDVLTERLTNSQTNEHLLKEQIFNLEEDCRRFEQQSNGHQKSIDELKTHLHLLSDENQQLKQDNTMLREENDVLISDTLALRSHAVQLQRQASPQNLSPSIIDSAKQINRVRTRHTPIDEAQIHSMSPVQSTASSSSNIERENDELEQLRANLLTQSLQCAQLEEANRAWQQYHQSQLDIFRQALKDWIQCDDQSTLEQLAQHILIRLNQLGNSNEHDYPSGTDATADSMQKQLTNYQLNESILAQNLEQLNQKLLDAYAQCEEFREHNAQLIASTQQLEQQSEERARQFLQLQETRDSLTLENQALQERSNDMEQQLAQFSTSAMMKRVDSPRENVAIHNIDRERVEEIRQLRTDLAAASNHCLQLEEANRAWQLYQQSQLDQFRQQLQEQIPMLNQTDDSSLDQMTQHVLNHIGQLAIERDTLMHQTDLLNNEVQLQRDTYGRPASVESDKRTARKRSDDTNIKEARIHNVTPQQSASPLGHHQHQQDLQQLRDEIVTLTTQCAQLDEANKAWQLYHATQVDAFRNKLHEHLSLAETGSLDDLAEQIVDQVQREREDAADKYKDFQRVSSDLRGEWENEMESTQLSHMGTVRELNEQVRAMAEQLQQLEAEKQLNLTDANKVEQRMRSVPSPRAVPGFEEVGIHTSGVHVDGKVAKVEERIAALTTQCAQLDEANQAWQLYHATQVDSFRNKLHEYLSLSETGSLDDLAEQIVDQVQRERDGFVEKSAEFEKSLTELLSASNADAAQEFPPENIPVLIGEISNLRKQYEELERLNGELSNEKEELASQLNDRPIASDLQLAVNATQTEEQEELVRLRDELASITNEHTDALEANKIALDSLRHQLQHWISIPPTSTLDDIGQQLNEQFEQLKPIIPQTVHNETQTVPAPKSVDIGVSTIAIVQKHHETQIDRPALLDQQIQTGSFDPLWSTADDADVLGSNDDADRLTDYIDDISSLSPKALSARLDKDCQQVLTKLNFQATLYPSLESNHRALIAVYSLYNQHLTDEAKHMYNETLIRALKQEYEFISTEKNDSMEKYLTLEDQCQQQLAMYQKKFENLQNKYDELLEHNELERLDSKQSVSGLVEQYDVREKQLEYSIYVLQEENQKLKYDFHQMRENYEKLQENDYGLLNKEYQQLREDYNEVINQNELLKDYNAQMYQDKFKGGKDNDSDEADLPNDVGVQCQLDEESPTVHPKPSDWNNDWNGEDISRPPSLPNNEGEEIDRLQAIIAEIQLENDNLKELNAQLFQAKQYDAENDSDDHTERNDARANRMRTMVVQEPVLTAAASGADNDWNDQMVSAEWTTTAPAPRDTADHETQTDELSQDKLSQVNNKLRRALQTIKEKVHQAAIEHPEIFTDTGDDTLERLDHLIAAVGNQAAQIQFLKNEMEEQPLQQDRVSDDHHSQLSKEVDQLRSELDERSEQLRELKEKYSAISSKIDDDHLEEYEHRIEALTDERDQLLERNQQLEHEIRSNANRESQRNIDPWTQRPFDHEEQDLQSTAVDGGKEHSLASSREVKSTSDHETQTEELTQDKLSQVNNKLRRALQTIKEKVHQAAIEHPEIFTDTGDDTLERLNHLIAAVGNQATQIEALRVETHELQSSLDARQHQVDEEHPVESESKVTAAPTSTAESVSIIDNYDKQIRQLQQQLSQKEDERALLRERLNEVELELSQASTANMYEEQLQSLVHERDALVEQQVLHSAESQRQVEELQQQLANLQTSSVHQHANQTLSADIRSLQEIIQQQSHELRDVSEKHLNLLCQVDAQADLVEDKREMEERFHNYEKQIESLIRENARLAEEIQAAPTSAVPTMDNESQTEEQQQDKLVQVNTKLKRALQHIKDKIQRIVKEQPDLFESVGDETSERLEHLIHLVSNQATQMQALMVEHNHSEVEFHRKIDELQSALEACQSELIHEHPAESALKATAAPTSTAESTSTTDNYAKQIRQLQQQLAQNEDERALLRERLNEVELELSQASTSSMYEEQLQSLVHERDALVDQYTAQLSESQREIEHLQQALAATTSVSVSDTIPDAADEDVQSLKEVIEEQTQELKDLSEKYLSLSSQFDSTVQFQADYDRQRKETEERMREYQMQIDHLNDERANLLVQLQSMSSSHVQAVDADKQPDESQHEKLVKMNTKLKRAVQSLKEKIHRLVVERPDLFENVGDETSERLDHLISTVKAQAVKIDLFETDRQQTEERYRDEIQELHRSLEDARRNISKQDVSTTVQRIDSEPTERVREITSQQAAQSNDNRWNDWFTAIPQTPDNHIERRSIDVQCNLLEETQGSSVTNRLVGFFKNVASPWSEHGASANDWDDQTSPIQLSSEEPLLEQGNPQPSSSSDHFIRTARTMIEQAVLRHPDIFPDSNGDTLEDLHQLLFTVDQLQSQIQQLERSFNAYRHQTETDRSMPVQRSYPNDVHTQTLGLSVVEEHRQKVEELRAELDEKESVFRRNTERLIEERDQAREQLSQLYEQLQEKDDHSPRSLRSIESQTDLDTDSLTESRLSECQCQIDVLLRERVSLMEQINQLAHQSTKQPAESQTSPDADPSTPADQRISRRVFEQEMLAWSKESEQLKQYVKQIQIENKKLKDIVLKFERITHDYMHENERLKQENQHLTFLSYPPVTTAGSASDTDICYLTLKCLTYEVAQRVSSDDHEQPSSSSSVMIDSNELYVKQRLSETERQLKTVRIQNQRLKKQLDTYTVQFKHVQHEMNTKIQELSTLKIEIDRLRTSETRYRLEVDRLQADLHCDQVKFQQLERELNDWKLTGGSNDASSTNNLRELLELKERELNALKEKLEYTIQAHQHELQESIKANQFSLDNVQRFEQLDQRHQEKRKELETRLGNICRLIRPLFDQPSLLTDDSIIDLHELQQLVTDTEAEERVTTSLGSIRDCLGLLEGQMKELHHNLIENHARRSTRWKYKLGFECLSCDSQWEVTHDVHNLQEACQDPATFLESSRVEPMNRCACPTIGDFIETDVLSCVDDIVDEVSVRTAVK